MHWAPPGIPLAGASNVGVGARDGPSHPGTFWILEGLYLQPPAPWYFLPLGLSLSSTAPFPHSLLASHQPPCTAPPRPGNLAYPLRSKCTVIFSMKTTPQLYQVRWPLLACATALHGHLLQHSLTMRRKCSPVSLQQSGTLGRQWHQWHACWTLAM